MVDQIDISKLFISCKPVPNAIELTKSLNQSKKLNETLIYITIGVVVVATIALVVLEHRKNNTIKILKKDQKN